MSISKRYLSELMDEFQGVEAGKGTALGNTRIRNSEKTHPVQAGKQNDKQGGSDLTIDEYNSGGTKEPEIGNPGPELKGTGSSNRYKVNI